MLCRVADSLYWIGRYLERAEHRARLLEVNLELMLYQTPEDIDAGWRRLCRILRVPASGDADEPLDAFVVAAEATHDPAYADSIVTCIARARENARQVREVISTEMWVQINRIHLGMASSNGNGAGELRAYGGAGDTRAAPTAFYQDLRRQLHLFAGITDATLLHGDGWRFLRLGRFIERAIATAQLLGGHLGTIPREVAAGPCASVPPPGEPRRDGRSHAATTEVAWVGLLQSCTAAEAYTKKYTADPRPRNVAEFLLLSPDFPHSLRFAVERACEVLQSLERSPIAAAASAALARGAGRLRAQLEFAAVDEILAGDPCAYLGDVREQCLRIHDLVVQQYIAYPLELASVYA